MLRDDIVKDESGACAVFTEQGSSASQMTAAKEMDVIASLPDMDKQLTPYQHTLDGGCSQTALNSKVRMSRYMDTCSTQVAQIMVKQ